MEAILDIFEIAIAWVFAALVLVIGGLATLHILLTKNDGRSAIAWIGFVLLVPFFGGLAYLLFGINRVRRQAQRNRIRRGLDERRDILNTPPGQRLEQLWPNTPGRWAAHAHLASRVAKRELTSGNRVKPLTGGRIAYDEMIEAINQATSSIALTTYIFQADQAGRRFVTALKRANERGVKTRVLVDSIGNLYGFRPVINLLKRHGIPVASFNSFRLSSRLAFFNLRTHRKLLVVDGNIGFAGGMNIRAGHLEQSDGSQRIRDTHFKLEGPVVAQLMDAFADDWLHTTGEDLDDPIWTVDPKPHEHGIVARGIPDGPDERIPKTSTILMSALSAARDHIQIVTPYFMPDNDLLRALSLAAFRGVKVDILVPSKSNLPFISLASQAYFPELLAAGCRIWQGSAPFDHSKLMVIDTNWCLFGSSNWDARSLRLNFEFNVELYAENIPEDIHNEITSRFNAAIEVPSDFWTNRAIFKRLASRFFWLLGPYL